MRTTVALATTANSALFAEHIPSPKSDNKKHLYSMWLYQMALVLVGERRQNGVTPNAAALFKPLTMRRLSYLVQ